MDAIKVPFVLDALLLSDLWMFDKRLGGGKSVEAVIKYGAFFGGLHAYCRFAADPSARKSSEFLEDEAWIMADDPGWEFSFINLCNELGIDPVSLRQVLIKWKNSHSISR